MATKLKELREAAKLTQEKLAQRAGVSTAVIFHIEQGRHTDPKLSTLVALAGALDLSPAQLVAELTRPEPKKGGGRK